MAVSQLEAQPMHAQYPFDPYNWSTITPLYAALLEAPRTGFMDWLGAWNRLDIAVHEAWTRLKLPAYGTHHGNGAYWRRLHNCSFQTRSQDTQR